MLSLIERAQREGTPLIAGDAATFVWTGATAPALIGDFNAWGEDGPLQLEPMAPEVWAQTLALPRDAFIEYAFVLNGARLLDPLNRHTVNTGLGTHNSWFRMPESVPFRVRRPAGKGARGALSRHTLHGEHLLVGGERPIWLYQPPTPEPVPLLVVLDGQDYLRRARLPAMVDALIARGRLRPIALALLAHGGPARFVEYACSESTVALIARHLLPLARRELRLLDPAAHPGAYGILGASLGGLMALYTSLRLPDIFGQVLCQSGGFALNILDHEQLIHQLLRYQADNSMRIWMDVGRFEFLLRANQETYALLTERGYDVTYHEYSGGHNYTAWRDDVWRGLEMLFGPPADPG
jgi:enterochelin esterase-like enzyme